MKTRTLEMDITHLLEWMQAPRADYSLDSLERFLVVIRRPAESSQGKAMSAIRRGRDRPVTT